MRLLSEWFPEFDEEFKKRDEVYKEKRMIDKKTYQCICFALSIKNCSKPCLLKHFAGALEAGTNILYYGADFQRERRRRRLLDA